MNAIDKSALTPNHIPAVIFRGSPSQLINLPVMIKTGLLLVVIVLAHVLWSFPFLVGLVPVFLGFLLIAWRYLCTFLTVITIDEERITVREGVLTKEVSSLELFRIQDVTFVQSWWQQFLGIGSVIVHTSDTVNPRWRLPGMRHAEQLRANLNRAAIALRDHKGYREINMGRV